MILFFFGFSGAAGRPSAPGRQSKAFPHTAPQKIRGQPVGPKATVGLGNRPHSSLGYRPLAGEAVLPTSQEVPRDGGITGLMVKYYTGGEIVGVFDMYPIGELFRP